MGPLKSTVVWICICLSERIDFEKIGDEFKISNTMNFIPSWHLKDRNSPTQDSRRYLGLLTFDQSFYTVYSVYGEKLVIFISMKNYYIYLKLLKTLLFA